MSRDPTLENSCFLNGEVLVRIESVTASFCTLSTKLRRPGDSVLRIRHLKLTCMYSSTYKSSVSVSYSNLIVLIEQPAFHWGCVQTCFNTRIASRTMKTARRRHLEASANADYNRLRYEEQLHTSDICY
jgi:hypothetical protein